MTEDTTLTPEDTAAEAAAGTQSLAEGESTKPPAYDPPSPEAPEAPAEGSRGLNPNALRGVPAGPAPHPRSVHPH